MTHFCQHHVNSLALFPPAYSKTYVLARSGSVVIRARVATGKKVIGSSRFHELKNLFHLPFYTFWADAAVAAWGFHDQWCRVVAQTYLTTRSEVILAPDCSRPVA